MAYDTLERRDVLDIIIRNSTLVVSVIGTGTRHDVIQFGDRLKRWATLIAGESRKALKVFPGKLVNDE